MDYTESSHKGNEMKIKQFVVITNPAEFLKGDYYSSLNLFDHETNIDGWIGCGEITLDIEVDSDELIRIVTDDLDTQIGAATAILESLEQKKAEFLSLPAPSEPHMSEYDAENEYNSDESITEIGDRENAILDAQERG